MKGMKHPGVCIALFCMLGLIASKSSLEYGFSELLQFGELNPAKPLPQVAELNYYVKPNSGGYDGQFYVQLAMDPSLTEPALKTAIDSPQYRSRRILMPAIAWALGLGNAEWILQIYPLLNIFAWFACAYMLLYWIDTRQRRGYACWFACLFSMGAMESLRLSLTDLPATAFILAALLCVEKKRTGSMMLSFGAAVMTKETSALTAIAFPKSLNHLSDWIKASFMAGIAIVPFAIWFIYSHSQFDPIPGVSPNINLPFVGIINAATESLLQCLNGNWDTRYSLRLVAIISLCIQAVYVIFYPQKKTIWWRVALVNIILLLSLAEYVWSGYWAAIRSILPLTFAFNILLDREHKHFWSIWLLGNASLLHGLIRWI